MTARRVPCAAAVMLAVLGPGCAPYSLRVGSCPKLEAGPGDRTVSVQYLGVSGVLLRHGDDVVLTAPLYSNPSLLEIGFDHAVKTDEALVDRLLPRAAGGASAILVGHSHFDHLMDVPYVALAKAKQATVYGSETTKLLLAASGVPDSRVVALEKLAGDDDTEGEWIAPPGSRRVRIMALRSEHSFQATLKLPFQDQPFPIHLWRGHQRRPLDEPPRSTSDWPEGNVFAFLIDFLGEDGKPSFRVYYQDSGTREPVPDANGRLPACGYPPRSLLASKRVDLAILCVGGDGERLRSHPGGILARTEPRYVLLTHWEDFFVPQDAYLWTKRFDAAGEPEYDPDARIYEIPPADQRKTPAFLKQATAAAPKDARTYLPCPTVSRFELPIR